MKRHEKGSGGRSDTGRAGRPEPRTGRPAPREMPAEPGLTGEYIAGRRPVEEALAGDLPLEKIFIRKDLAERPPFAGLLRAARENGVPLVLVPAPRLESLAPGIPHRGVLALAATRAYADLPQLLARAHPPQDPPFLLLLDEIQDPRNLGALARSAESAGVHGIILPRRRSAGLTASAESTSAGALAHLPVAQVTNLVRTMEALKEAGIWLVGADPASSQLCWDAPLTGPLALVLGSEGHGLGRLVKEHCDLLVSIPQRGQVRSLNVSAAGAVLMFEVRRQRTRAQAGLEGKQG